jgi:aminoglycoside 6'-N-acetyltransferase I
MNYIRANTTHAQAIATLALLLWSDHELEEMIQDFTEDLQNENQALFLCLDDTLEVGFAQFALRHDYVEGTDRQPVGYVEGIYVREGYRHKGIAKRLIRLGEGWAQGKGCCQMASDCELTNTDSLHFHLNCGFSEANRIICFVKDIQPGEKNTACD